MKKSQIVFLVLIELLFILAPVSAQNQNDSTIKVSSYETKPDSISENKNEVIQSLPPANKKIGIGFNPFRFVTWYGKINDGGCEREFRCAVSLFAVDRKAEIAFPVQYMFGKENNIPWRVLYIETTYRRFFNNHQKGGYYSGGVRYRYIEGEQLITSSVPHIDPEHTGVITRQSNVGIYLGIGYRFFAKRGLYCGSNLIIGTYFGPKLHNIVSAEDVPYNFILGCDLLEIGYAF
jgi:hypothetical protein